MSKNVRHISRSLGLDGKGGRGGGGKGSRTSWLREEKNKEDYDRDPSRLGAMKSGQLFLLLGFLFILEYYEYIHRDLTVRNRNLNPRSRISVIRITMIAFTTFIFGSSL
jgi:hypothetical protein